ncbi:hypothetical protein AABC03_01185 [Staphylococcus nepalensis]
MAYEYEDEVKSVIATETVFSHEETEKETRVKEVQEVYRKAKAFDEIELTVTQPATELQITKDSSIQAIPLSNEAYEKAVKGEGVDDGR